MGWIYKITNIINGKMYIGKTEDVDPQKRWKEHLRDYKKERNNKRPLYMAMCKYGVENFNFEILEETNDSEQSCEREKFWIDELRTYVGFKDCNGYNATLGGDGKAWLNLNEEEVISYHISPDALLMLHKTAEHFGVDVSTIKKILKKHNVTNLSKEYISYYQMLLNKNSTGGIYKIHPKGFQIIDYYVNYIELVEDNQSVNKKVLANIVDTGKLYRGFLWYSVNGYIQQNIEDKENKAYEEYKNILLDDSET